MFARSGKHLTRVTPAGEAILAIAGEVLQKCDAIRQVAQEFSDEKKGKLEIATTHTQARYALPDTIHDFIKIYPDVSLHIHQGTPMQISEMAADGTADFAIATEAMSHFSDLIMMPCYRWNRSVVVPKGHPLTELPELTLEALSEWPLITYVFGFTGRSKLDEAFSNRGLEPKVVLTAVDSDVIKTYVRLGLGVGHHRHHGHLRKAKMKAWSRSMRAICLSTASPALASAKGLSCVATCTTSFKTFAPHLTPDLVRQVQACSNRHEVDALFEGLNLPEH